jgi:pimeloyl-ACP methyl ester carboxylesterase
MHNLARHSAISRERSLEHIIERAEGMRDINRLAQPTLLILGSRDRQIYIDNARIYLKNSHVLTKIIDTGHHSVMSRPQLILRLIASFAQNSKRPENKV